MEIRQATIANIEEVSILFDEYRTFYNQPSDITLARQFLTDRFIKNDSIVFLAIDNNEAIAFAQLYPSFTSVGAKEIWILNDLFVLVEHRQKGVAQFLINFILDYSKQSNRKKVVLSTANDNLEAQALYEKLGFIRDSFVNYEKLTD